MKTETVWLFGWRYDERDRVRVGIVHETRESAARRRRQLKRGSKRRKQAPVLVGPVVAVKVRA